MVLSYEWNLAWLEGTEEASRNMRFPESAGLVLNPTIGQEFALTRIMRVQKST